MEKTPINKAPTSQIQNNISLSKTQINNNNNNNDNENENENEIGEKHNPTIHIGNLELDRDSAIVMLLNIFMWIMIWKISGLWKTLLSGQHLIFPFIFIIYIVYMLMNMFISGTSSGGVVYELNILLTVEQMISILFGTTVLFLLFEHNLPLGDNCRQVVKLLIISSTVILSIASLWVNIWTSGQAFRAVRKFKQGVYNMSLCLFLLVCIIYAKGKCPENLR